MVSRSPTGNRPTPEEKLLIDRRREAAAAMKRAGATWQNIADSDLYPAGTSKAQAYIDVRRGLQEANRDMRLEMELLRQVEGDRLDDYLLRLRPGIIAGDTKAINTAVRIVETRARLFGLNEPERHEVITVDSMDVALRELRAEINRRAAGVGEPGPGMVGPASPEDRTGPA